MMKKKNFFFLKFFLQESFIDTYANLTVKSLFLLKWFNTHCDKTQYVMKTDDDMYINLDKLYATVQSNKRPNLLMGSLICNAIPIKDPYNKWYVPHYMFAGKRYPNYLSGTHTHRHTIICSFSVTKQLQLLYHFVQC